MDYPTIELLLERHAPAQLEMALEKLSSAAAHSLVRIISSGRFGFRKGFKKLLRESQAPSPPPSVPSAPEEEACPEDRQAALDQLGQHYLGEKTP